MFRSHAKVEARRSASPWPSSHPQLDAYHSLQPFLGHPILPFPESVDRYRLICGLCHAIQDARDPLARHESDLLVRLPAAAGPSAQEAAQRTRKGCEGHSATRGRWEVVQTCDRRSRQPRPSECNRHQPVCGAQLARPSSLPGLELIISLGPLLPGPLCGQCFRPVLCP